MAGKTALQLVSLLFLVRFTYVDSVYECVFSESEFISFGKNIVAGQRLPCRYTLLKTSHQGRLDSFWIEAMCDKRTGYSEKSVIVTALRKKIHLSVSSVTVNQIPEKRDVSIIYPPFRLDITQKPGFKQVFLNNGITVTYIPPNTGKVIISDNYRGSHNLSGTCGNPWSIRRTEYDTSRQQLLKFINKKPNYLTKYSTPPSSNINPKFDKNPSGNRHPPNKHGFLNPQNGLLNPLTNSKLPDKKRNSFQDGKLFHSCYSGGFWRANGSVWMTVGCRRIFTCINGFVTHAKSPGCSEFADCVKTRQGAACLCRPSFIGNGVTCIYIQQKHPPGSGNHNNFVPHITPARPSKQLITTVRPKYKGKTNYPRQRNRVPKPSHNKPRGRLYRNRMPNNQKNLWHPSRRLPFLNGRGAPWLVDPLWRNPLAKFPGINDLNKGMILNSRQPIQNRPLGNKSPNGHLQPNYTIGNPKDGPRKLLYPNYRNNKGRQPIPNPGGPRREGKNPIAQNQTYPSLPDEYDMLLKDEPGRRLVACQRINRKMICELLPGNNKDLRKLLNDILHQERLKKPYQPSHPDGGTNNPLQSLNPDGSRNNNPYQPSNPDRGRNNNPYQPPNRDGATNNPYQPPNRDGATNNPYQPLNPDGGRNNNPYQPSNPGGGTNIPYQSLNPDGGRNNNLHQPSNPNGGRNNNLHQPSNPDGGTNNPYQPPNLGLGTNNPYQSLNPDGGRNNNPYQPSNPDGGTNNPLQSLNPDWGRNNNPYQPPNQDGATNIPYQSLNPDGGRNNNLHQPSNQDGGTNNPLQSLNPDWGRNNNPYQPRNQDGATNNPYQSLNPDGGRNNNLHQPSNPNGGRNNNLHQPSNPDDGTNNPYQPPNPGLGTNNPYQSLNPDGGRNNNPYQPSNLDGGTNNPLQSLNPDGGRNNNLHQPSNPDGGTNNPLQSLNPDWGRNNNPYQPRNQDGATNNPYQSLNPDGGRNNNLHQPSNPDGGRNNPYQSLNPDGGRNNNLHQPSNQDGGTNNPYQPPNPGLGTNNPYQSLNPDGGRNNNPYQPSNLDGGTNNPLQSLNPDWGRNNNPYQPPNQDGATNIPYQSLNPDGGRNNNLHQPSNPDGGRNNNLHQPSNPDGGRNNPYQSLNPDGGRNNNLHQPSNPDGGTNNPYQPPNPGLGTNNPYQSLNPDGGRNNNPYQPSNLDGGTNNPLQSLNPDWGRNNNPYQPPNQDGATNIPYQSLNPDGGRNNNLHQPSNPDGGRNNNLHQPSNPDGGRNNPLQSLNPDGGRNNNLHQPSNPDGGTNNPLQSLNPNWGRNNNPYQPSNPDGGRNNPYQSLNPDGGRNNNPHQPSNPDRGTNNPYQSLNPDGGRNNNPYQLSNPDGGTNNPLLSVNPDWGRNNNPYQPTNPDGGRNNNPYQSLNPDGGTNNPYQPPNPDGSRNNNPYQSLNPDGGENNNPYQPPNPEGASNNHLNNNKDPASRVLPNPKQGPSGAIPNFPPHLNQPRYNNPIHSDIKHVTQMLWRVSRKHDEPRNKKPSNNNDWNLLPYPNDHYMTPNPRGSTYPFHITVPNRVNFLDSVLKRPSDNHFYFSSRLPLNIPYVGTPPYNNRYILPKDNRSSPALKGDNYLPNRNANHRPNNFRYPTADGTIDGLVIEPPPQQWPHGPLNPNTRLFNKVPNNLKPNLTKYFNKPRKINPFEKGLKPNAKFRMTKCQLDGMPCKGNERTSRPGKDEAFNQAPHPVKHQTTTQSVNNPGRKRKPNPDNNNNIRPKPNSKFRISKCQMDGTHCTQNEQTLSPGKDEGFNTPSAEGQATTQSVNKPDIKNGHGDNNPGKKLGTNPDNNNNKPNSQQSLIIDPPVQNDSPSKKCDDKASGNKHPTGLRYKIMKKIKQSVEEIHSTSN